ncbi:hypothetical protein V500_05682 [Pseudogymnoascus sp. VKM F-4518 (FW-2643)]|nr:hypothetical protein V500_05682 [Pseudogymnoascus sp. VKM F-4518 (FW-2643)]
MFKIPKEEDRERALNQYKILRKTAVKDGKPYILACEAGHAGQEPRAQGWTLAVKSTFASKGDMDYYDNECEAHKALKAVVSGIRTDVMTVWFESALNERVSGVHPPLLSSPLFLPPSR